MFVLLHHEHPRVEAHVVLDNVSQFTAYWTDSGSLAGGAMVAETVP